MPRLETSIHREISTKGEWVLRVEMFGRWKRKHEPRSPDRESDAGQTQQSDYTADPRELVGTEGVAVTESPGAAEERRAEEP
jgi:hypothetical protein